MTDLDALYWANYAYSQGRLDEIGADMIDDIGLNESPIHISKTAYKDQFRQRVRGQRVLDKYPAAFAPLERGQHH